MRGKKHPEPNFTRVRLKRSLKLSSPSSPPTTSHITQPPTPTLLDPTSPPPSLILIFSPPMRLLNPQLSTTQSYHTFLLSVHRDILTLSSALSGVYSGVCLYCVCLSERRKIEEEGRGGWEQYLQGKEYGKPGHHLRRTRFHCGRVCR